MNPVAPVRAIFMAAPCNSKVGAYRLDSQSFALTEPGSLSLREVHQGVRNIAPPSRIEFGIRFLGRLLCRDTWESTGRRDREDIHLFTQRKPERQIMHISIRVAAVASTPGRRFFSTLLRRRGRAAYEFQDDTLADDVGEGTG